MQDVKSKKIVVGAGMEGGAQYTYDLKKKEHSVSIGYSIISYERTGDSNFIGINFNISGGIGIGGEAGVKLGFNF